MQGDIGSKRALFEGNRNMLYYFSPNSARLGVGMKSVTRGHCAVERISLWHVSAAACFCVILEICLENLSYISVSVRESVKDNQVAHRNRRYLGDSYHLSKKKKVDRKD